MNSEERQQHKEAVNGSIMRACHILELFDLQHPRWTQKEIAQACGLSATTVMPVLRALEANGFLERDVKSKQYSLGMKFVEMGQRKVNSIDMTAISSELLETVSHRFMVNTHLGIYFQGDIMYLSRHQAIIHQLSNSYVGKRIPVHCSALGKAILAHMSYEKLSDVVAVDSMFAFTQHTVTDPAVLEEQLVQVRQRGYSVDDEEYQRGGYCIGVPLFNVYGTVCGAISCSVVKTEENMKKVSALIDAMIETGAEISRRMGYVPKK